MEPPQLVDKTINRPNPKQPTSYEPSTSNSSSSDGNDFIQIDTNQLTSPSKSLYMMPSTVTAGSNPFITDDDLTDTIPHSSLSQSIFKYDVPDPNRIPACAFARPTNVARMDWSVASNESLFSIPVGNHSFSRDHVFLMGGLNDPFPPPSGSDDLSAESLDTREQAGSQDGGYAGEGSPSSYKCTNLDKEREMSGSDFDHVRTQTSSPYLESRSSVSRQSEDCSSVGARSFAFPVLNIGEGRKGSAEIEKINQSHHYHLYGQESKKLQEKPLKPAVKIRRWTCSCVKRVPRLSCCSKHCC